MYYLCIYINNYNACMKENLAKIFHKVFEIFNMYAYLLLAIGFLRKAVSL